MSLTDTSFNETYKPAANTERLWTIELLAAASGDSLYQLLLSNYHKIMFIVWSYSMNRDTPASRWEELKPRTEQDNRFMTANITLCFNSNNSKAREISIAHVTIFFLVNCCNLVGDWKRKCHKFDDILVFSSLWFV